MTDKKKKWLWFCLVVLPLICSRSADAISKKNVIRILLSRINFFIIILWHPLFFFRLDGG